MGIIDSDPTILAEIQIWAIAKTFATSQQCRRDGLHSVFIVMVAVVVFVVVTLVMVVVAKAVVVLLMVFFCSPLGPRIY